MRQTKKIEKPVVAPHRHPKIDLGRCLLNLEDITSQLSLMPQVPQKAEAMAIIQQAHELITDIKETL